MAEELLIPLCRNADPGRLNMFCSQVAQAVVLKKPELPRVFSNFENKFGSYTSAVRSLPMNAKLISKFEKNALQTIYAFEFEDGTVGIHIAAPVRHLTENFGYELNHSFLDGMEVGTDIAANSVIQSWPCTDEHGNFAYGVNLKTAFMNFKGQSYEDGIIISESAAGRLTHTSIDVITVTINANDLTVNTLGTPGDHKGFPDVGEMIQSGILLARRRINHDSILHDLSTAQLGRINNDTDTLIYAEGRVMDIDVYSNLDAERLDLHPFNKQILKYHNRWLEYRQWFLETFGPYVRGEIGNGYSEDVAFWYRLVEGTTTDPWRHEHAEFDGVVLKFIVAKDNPVVKGCKLSNRVGGKGVVSAILPDSEMPGGVDMIVNMGGVINRMNISQNYESELNFIADQVLEQMSDMMLHDARDHLLKFFDIVAPGQANWLRSTLSDDDWYDYLNELLNGEAPIRIHQAPFFGAVDLEDLERAYAEFNVRPVKVDGIEEPLILGSNYYMKLRHEPSSKFSARSAKHLSISGVPVKNARGVRNYTEHHSTTPIRIGEQELQNLMISNNPDELKRMLRLYATDDQSREGAIVELATRSNPFSMDKIEAKGSGITRPVAGLQALLESIGIRLEKPDTDME